VAEERFIDYFIYAGLNPSAPRDANYRLLLQKHRENEPKPSDDAKLYGKVLKQAQVIFNDPVKYDAYRKQYDLLKQDNATSGAGAPAPEAAGAAPGSAPQKGLRSVFGEFVSAAVQGYVNNKASPARTGQAGLTGRWHDNAGCFLDIRQAGGSIAVAVMNSFGIVVSRGQGVIRGSTIDYQARDSTGQFGQGVLQISPDGIRLDGEITWYNAYNMPTGSGRVSFVRS
jgi:hypothetical protein